MDHNASRTVVRREDGDHGDGDLFEAVSRPVAWPVALDPKVQATYVFGIDRNGKLPAGPFPGRPDIRFDALVLVTLTPDKAPTASVTDLAT